MIQTFGASLIALPELKGAIAMAVLNLLAVLLGTILVGRVYLMAYASAKERGLKL